MATEIASSQIIHVAGFAEDIHFESYQHAAALEHLVGSKKLRVRITSYASQKNFQGGHKKIGQLDSRE